MVMPVKQVCHGCGTTFLGSDCIDLFCPRCSLGEGVVMTDDMAIFPPGWLKKDVQEASREIKAWSEETVKKDELLRGWLMEEISIENYMKSKDKDDIKFREYEPWKPMTNSVDLKNLCKLSEELAGALSAAQRCILQGIDEKEPETGKVNKVWLEEELADVLANAKLVINHFDLDIKFIEKRMNKKMPRLKSWHDIA